MKGIPSSGPSHTAYWQLADRTLADQAGKERERRTATSTLPWWVFPRSACPKVYWRVEGDYIGTSFDGSMQSNYGAGVGLVLTVRAQRRPIRTIFGWTLRRSARYRRVEDRVQQMKRIRNIVVEIAARIAHRLSHVGVRGEMHCCRMTERVLHVI